MAKFRYTDTITVEVKTQVGKFTASPDTVYEIRGKAVADISHDPRFTREDESVEAEVPAWQSL